MEVEKANDGKLYLVSASLDHMDGCLKGPDETVEEQVARGQLYIPKELLDDAMGMKRAGFSTTDINTWLSHRVEERQEGKRVVY